MARKQECIGHSTIMQTRIGYILRHDSLLYTQPNRGQDTGQSNQRKKVPANAQRHHK